MRRLPFVPLAWAFLIALAPAFGTINVSDDAGRSVTLAQPARRIVSLSPHATELLFAAGAGERVVGVAAYSDYPPDAAILPHIGDARALDLERIVSLKPDLAVAWLTGNNRQQVDKLAASGIAVFYSEPRRAEDVASNLERLGELAGTVEAGVNAAQRFRTGLRELQASYRGARPVTVFYEIWHTPIMTLNGHHLVSDMLGRCGARNVFAALPALAPTVSLEAVIAAAPEVIATGAGPEALEFWRRRREIPAARTGHLCQVDATRMHRAGPRLLDAARELCGCIDRARR
jgi:iron complex transport system substrate-binding protein